MPEPRSLTVDATLRHRMVTDLWRHNLRTLRGAGILRYSEPVPWCCCSGTTWSAPWSSQQRSSWAGSAGGGCG
ncbi:hypothetical protein [Pedococcus bigeumensis]|uniref:hypothetical protein n=1 Tax=Pedococcus bigeumensis TaxID=433644 RepID=UPI002FEC2C63